MPICVFVAYYILNCMRWLQIFTNCVIIYPKLRFALYATTAEFDQLCHYLPNATQTVCYDYRNAANIHCLVMKHRQFWDFWYGSRIRLYHAGYWTLILNWTLLWTVASLMLTEICLNSHFYYYCYWIFASKFCNCKYGNEIYLSLLPFCSLNLASALILFYYLTFV